MYSILIQRNFYPHISYCHSCRSSQQSSQNNCTVIAASNDGSCYGSWFVTVRKRSCGKVMFSQACVKNSVHRGRCTPPGRHPLGRLPQVDNPQGRHPQQTAPLPLQQTATVADGTHPTGMHASTVLF